MKPSIFFLLFSIVLQSSCGGACARNSTAACEADSSAVTFQLRFDAPDAVRLQLLPLKTLSAVADVALDTARTRQQLTLKFDDTEDAFAALVSQKGGGILTARIPYGEYKKGKVYEWELELSAPEVKVGKSPEFIQHARLAIPAGQYSGITRIGDDTYAVVHDKAKGGGLYIFTLALRADGSIQDASAFETDAGGPAGRDNEDVVYVPETQTVFVSAEGDQSIREYRLDGKETGRQLRIPDDLKTILPNAGFEALAYSKGCFWTTTEAPIPGEILPRLHRIQAFSLDSLDPTERYLYLADAPAVSDAEAGSAQAYVHGISAMTALPDGRLAVLEREVYVPASGVFSMLAESFTQSTIYLVDPAQCKAGILEKTLLTRFRTSALTLSNFEGMCLGPVLADGRQTLLLIADSQGGSGGLTGEYLRILAL